MKRITVILVIGIILLSIALLASLAYIVINDESEPEPYVDPYASILDKSANYSSAINYFLSEANTNLTSYYNTNDITYFVNANNHTILARNILIQYEEWHMYEIWKELDDITIDKQIFENIRNLGYVIRTYERRINFDLRILESQNG